MILIRKMIHMIQRDILNSKESVLDNFYLFNSEEISNFINSNNGLLELLESVYHLLESYFPNCTYSLHYAQDPEIIGLEDLMLFIKVDEKEFKNYRNKLHDLEREIDDLKISNPKVKRLLLVELIY